MQDNPGLTTAIGASVPFAQDKEHTYNDYLQASFGKMIERLPLNEFQKDFLRSRWLDQIIWMEKRAGKSRDRYYRLRMVTIIGGVIVPILVSLNTGDPQKEFSTALRYATIGLSAVVAASSAVDEFFHYGERWRHYRRSVESLKTQGWQFIQLTGPYASYNKTEGYQEAFPLFVNQVEEIIQRDVELYSTQVIQERKEEKDQQKAS